MGFAAQASVRVRAHVSVPQIAVPDILGNVLNIVPCLPVRIICDSSQPFVPHPRVGMSVRSFIPTGNTRSAL